MAQTMQIKRLPSPPSRALRGIPLLAAGLALLAWLLWQGAPVATVAQAAGQGPTIDLRTPRLVYTVLEPQQRTSSIWLAAPEDPARARKVAEVAHREGYGLKAAVSPSGSEIAYLRLPRDANDPATQAELWVHRLNGGAPRRLGEGLDLLSRPVFSPDGARVLVRRTTPGPTGDRHTLLSVETGGGESSRILPDLPALGLYPIGWTRDGSAVIYDVLSAAGSDIYRLDLATRTSRRLLHASDGIARDFQLSSDHERLLYSEFLPAGPATQGASVGPLMGPALTGAGTPAPIAFPYRIRSADLSTGESVPLRESMQALVGPVWGPARESFTFGSSPREPETRGAAAVQSLGEGRRVQSVAEPPQGSLLVPLGWSPDTRFLAAREVSGGDRPGPTVDRLVVISGSTGEPVPVHVTGFPEFAGWAP